MGTGLAVGVGIIGLGAAAVGTGTGGGNKRGDMDGIGPRVISLSGLTSCCKSGVVSGTSTATCTNW